MLGTLKDIADRRGKRLFVWTVTEGLRRYGASGSLERCGVPIPAMVLVNRDEVFQCAF